MVNLNLQIARVNIHVSIYLHIDYRVLFPEKLSEKIEADSQQKLVMRFLLKDGANKKPMRTHQAFVRLSSASTSTSANNDDKRGHEILFVAETDTSHLYKFDMVIISRCLFTYAGSNLY